MPRAAGAKRATRRRQKPTDSLDDLLRAALDRTDDPRARRWLQALLAGDYASTDPNEQKPNT